MRFLKCTVWLLLLSCMSVLTYGQVKDTVAAKADSAMRDPLKTSQKAIVVKDTAAKLNDKPLKEEPKKKEPFKDSIRLALEALPGKSARRSALVPGWGQLTNGRWWKVPFIYGGMVSVALVFEFNNRYYRDIVKVLQYNTEPDKFPRPDNYEKYQNFQPSSLISARDYYRRNRDLSALAFIAFHAINVIDAYVDAKFFRYDISDKLGFKVTPTVLMNQPTYAFSTPVPALKITIPL